MSNLNFAFLGSTNFSKELLLYLIENDLKASIIFSIPEKFNISYSSRKVVNSNYASLKEIATSNRIPHYEIDSLPGKRITDYTEILKDLNLDLILALGWYYMIPKKIRTLAKYGAWGIHASMLPKYAGGAPLNWAIINGEKETGVTLFRMDDGVDDGDIIAQNSFSILYQDTIKDVYLKATNESKKILKKTLKKNIEEIEFKKQDKSKLEVYPQRSPEEGEIDLTKSSKELYNFIRAQSKPYPGAYIRTVDGKKLIIEKARVE
ncbi:MAG: hypothetical protein CMD68_00460 [Gammaproteobacteria bacterium]|nr:hypothetical protein [Gammaproteobacteria bacterium]